MTSGQLHAGYSDTLIICYYYTLHQKTFISIWPHSLAYHGVTAHNVLHCQVGVASTHSLDTGLESSTWSSSCLLDRPTPQQHWICPSRVLRHTVLRNHGGAMRQPELGDDDHLLHEIYSGSDRSTSDATGTWLTVMLGYANNDICAACEYGESWPVLWGGWKWYLCCMWTELILYILHSFYVWVVV